MKQHIQRLRRTRRMPNPLVSLVPIAVLIITIVSIVATKGATAVGDYSWMALLSDAALAAVIAIFLYGCSLKRLKLGIIKSAIQISPTIPILILIATVAASWMMGGVVPTLISYGLQLINADIFLVLTCIVCALISVLTGSSWTTCATIGVAFMGIGTVMGFDEAWIAGAVISGAYFGDKISPLSDTTVLASSTADVKLFDHVKYMMGTTIPAMLVALTVFTIKGFMIDGASTTQTNELLIQIDKAFVISPWLLLVPVITCLLIVMRIHTLITLSISTLLGLAGLIFFQPHVLTTMQGDGSAIGAIAHLLCTENTIETGNELLNNLVTTGGIMGIFNTILLVSSAIVFGGILFGSGMLSSITQKWLSKLRNTTAVVATTDVSGVLINCSTGDQYLSLILAGNMFKKLYKRLHLPNRLLSRSLEDSISVTSVLVPWNSCGMTQATVLGVSTIYYIPYCVFNWMCPIVSVIVAWIISRKGIRN